MAGGGDEDEDDPLTEVNVYLAYERYDQAEELVRSAIAQYPDRNEYKLRLLEVFYAAKDLGASAVLGWGPGGAITHNLAVGDLVAMPVTGAYGHSMGSNYNKITRPPVVFVADGEARLVVRRETYDDLLAVAQRAEAVRRFHALGGVVALGNDYGGIPDVQQGMPMTEMGLLLAAGLTPMEVIEAGTRHAAFVCGQGDMLGTLEPGKLADIVVLSENIMTVPEDEILQARVLYTIVGGKMVYNARQRGPRGESKQ